MLAIALFMVARVAGLGSRLGSLLAVVTALEVALWMPEGIRDWTLAVLVGMAVFAGWDGEPGSSAIAGLTATVLIIVLGWIPGGNTAIILSGLGVVGFFRVRGSARHLIRLRRTATLRPGELPGGDVMIGGTLHQGKAISMPLGHELTDALWWAICVGDDYRATSGVVRLDTEAGTVLADLTRARFEITSERSKYDQLGQKDAVDALFDGPFATRERHEGDDVEKTPLARFEQRTHYSLHWLRAGDQVMLMGTPEWERAPAELAGYRDAPLVPMFRGRDVFMANKSVTAVKRDAIWNVIAWSAWTPVCAVVGGLQLANLV